MNRTVPTARLIADYARGVSLKQLARHYPLSRSAIYYRRKRAGVTMRPNGARRGNTNATRGQA